MKKLLILILILSITSIAQADCVYSAKNKNSYTLLDRNTIMLTGGYGGDIIIKTWCYIYSSSSISILKDSFCSFESSVMYIDGNVCDARQVTRVQ